jgi:hypothetical protein
MARSWPLFKPLPASPFVLSASSLRQSPFPKGIYKGKDQLYFYMTRYLIERLSWLCGDHTVVNADAKAQESSWREDTAASRMAIR